jgi:hypothetical protein
MPLPANTPTMDRLLTQPKPMPAVNRLLAHERRPGSAPAAGNGQDLLGLLGRTLQGLPYRAPLPAHPPAPARPAPAVAPPTAAQPAQRMSDDQALEIAKNNLLPVFRRVKQLVNGELTYPEVVAVNKLVWQFGRPATAEEIEAVSQYLAERFETGPAPPPMAAESS